MYIWQLKCIDTKIQCGGFLFVCFNALHLYLKSVFSLYRWKWKVGSKNSLWYCEHGQWNLLITMKIIAMRSQSSYVMGQLTLRWNLMKSVKLKGGNLILCCVRYQYLFAGFQYLCAEGQVMFHCARNTSFTQSVPSQFLQCAAYHTRCYFE